MPPSPPDDEPCHARARRYVLPLAQQQQRLTAEVPEGVEQTAETDNKGVSIAVPAVRPLAQAKRERRDALAQACS
jgi:hypothetical protein